MSLDQILNEKPKGSARLVHWLNERLGTVRRRDVFVGAAVAGSAMATNPKAYALQPQTAYATICGPGNTYSSGWTVFCATVNGGKNVCPPGSFAAGWWKAAGSSWCGGGYRYIVDCNATCSKCTSGCADHICNSSCWSCSCGSGPSTSCDQRRHCCNAFRYGQCNTQVSCSGGVNCRVVSCVAPYTWAACSTTSFQDDRTSEHSSDLLPVWGQNAARYRQLGEFRSYLKGSIGPQYSVGDGKGTYINYQGGSIYHSSATGAKALDAFTVSVWKTHGGPTGPLGYPSAERVTGLRDGGWIVLFQGGCLIDSPNTSTSAVIGAAWASYTRVARERGPLGYPTKNVARNSAGGWLQTFQHGMICGAAPSAGYAVYGAAYQLWAKYGLAAGILGYPITEARNPSTGWMQNFQRGVIVDSTSTNMCVVAGAIYTRWAQLSRQTGVLGFPTANPIEHSRGGGQVFQRGEIWGLTGQAAFDVRGRPLAAWKAAGGVGGRYGYPVANAVTNSNGTITCRFENGTITL